MSNEFENNNDGGETNQNPYYQDYGAPSQGSGQQENNTDPYQNAGNQDYSNPYQSGQPDYSNSYQSGQQDYGSQYQSGQQNYGNPYQSGQQTYGGYNPYGNGNVPLDKKGQPLKNRFGMKLTFSILEMISGNLISLICGIIACVFTCKANTSYKEGKWEEFKSNAKISNIFLWIGLGVCLAFYVIVIILIAAVGLSVLPFVGSGNSGSSVGSGSYDYYDEQDYNYYDDDADEEETEDYADDWEEEDTEDADTGYASAGVTAGSGYTDPTVTINGATVTFPLSYADFVAETGLTMDADETGDIVSADGYDNYDITNAYDSEGNDVCSIWLYNMSGSDLAMEDCYVAGIIAYNDGYSETPDLVMQNGITFASTQDEVRTALGVPSDTYSDTYSDGSLYETWNWDYADPDSDYFDEVEIEFVDGVITKIEVDNATLPAGQ